MTKPKRDPVLTAKDKAWFKVMVQYEVKPLRDEVKRLRKVIEGKQEKG